MTDLTTEEKAALVKALDNGGELSGRFCSVVTASDLYARGGLVHSSRVTAPLTPAGHIVATLLRENEAGRRLERAKELLAEWEKMADDARQPHPMLACTTLTYEPGHDWCATFEWAERNEKLGCHSVCASGERQSPDPLTAVIATSQQTPWKLEE